MGLCRTLPYSIPYHTDTIPYHTIPHHTIPYHTRYHTILDTIPYRYRVPYHTDTIPYRVPYHTISTCTIPYYTNFIPYHRQGNYGTTIRAPGSGTILSFMYQVG